MAASGSRKVKLIKHSQHGPNVETLRDTVKFQSLGGPQARSLAGDSFNVLMLTNKPVNGITDIESECIK